MWFDACAENDLQTVRRLLPAMAGQQNGLGQTGLMFAAQRGHLAVVKALVEQERGLSDDHSQTALMYASDANQLACVLVLAPWEAGLVDAYGHTARDYARLPEIRFALRQEEWDDAALGTFMQFVRQKTRALEDVLRGRGPESLESSTRAKIKAERFRGTQFYAAARRLEECVGRLERGKSCARVGVEGRSQGAKSRLSGQREAEGAGQRPAVA